MQIGEISKQAGVSVDAVRFYERSGLLPTAPRSVGGYRQYSAADAARLEFVRHLQALGFSLHEIREFLALRHDDVRACGEVREKLRHKLRAVHAKRASLARIECELKSALRKCNRALARPPLRSGGRCPVLKVIREKKRTAAP